MTTSQNVDRIYQLLCRVIRKHPEGQKKLFFKVAPNIHSDYYKYIMTAVLSLSDESFFTKFNGKNFSDMIIPVIKTKRDHHEPNNGGGNGKPRPKTLKLIDFEGLPVFSFFKDLYHKKDALLHVYAYTTVRDVRGEFLDWKPNGYWTKEKCIEDALKYNSQYDWLHLSGKAYNAARKCDWLDECCIHMDSVFSSWTKEKCMSSALKYQKLKDWYSNDVNAYNAARNYDWFEECTSHMTRRKVDGYWNKEVCIEDALNYTSRHEWQKNNNTAYSIARKNGWLEECCGHMDSVRIVWTKDDCVKSALRYKTKIEWINGDKKAYVSAVNNGWLVDCTKHMKNLRASLTKEECLESALKYEFIIDWVNNEKSVYSYARKYGWLEECTKHMKRKQQSWNKEKCLESALKFANKNDWFNNEAGAVGAAKRNGWYEECTAHMQINRSWTKENCINDALKYNKLIDWIKNSGGAYNAARKNKWLFECTEHMKKNKNVVFN